MAGYLGINTCIILAKYVLYCLLFLTLNQCTNSQEISITISDTLKEDERATLLCLVSYPADIFGGTFTWKHSRYAGGVVYYDDNETKDNLRIRTESVSVNTSAPFSSLTIFNSSADDSGIITCQYEYRLVSGSIRTLNVDTFVCVSKVPELPQCFQGGTAIICFSDEICSDDITLQWFDMDSMQVLNGSVTRSNTTIENTLVTDTNVDNYICILKSDIYPDIQHTCSTSIAKSTSILPTSVTTIISSGFDDITVEKMSTSKMILSSSYIRSSIVPSSSTTSTSPQTFPITLLIIAVCIGAGGMLLLIVIMITIYVICRKLNDDISKRDFDVQFELDERHVHSDKEKEDGSNNPPYCTVEHDNGSTAETGTVHMHAEPLQNDTSEDALPDSSYASIPDCKDEGSCRSKMRSSVNSNADDYAYPNFLPSISQSTDSTKTVSPIFETPATMDSQSQHQSEYIEDDIPHYTDVNTDLHDMTVVSEDIPVYAKPDKHITVSNLEKGLSNPDTSDSETQHQVRDVTGNIVVSHDTTPSDDMPVYAKPTKTSKVDNVEEESLEPAGDLTADPKPQHRANIKSDINDDGGHDQAYASILLSDPTPDSCNNMNNDNTVITSDNLLKIDNDDEDKNEADNTSKNPIYFELEKS